MTIVMRHDMTDMTDSYETDSQDRQHTDSRNRPGKTNEANV
jgi:hypothetical protein